MGAMDYNLQCPVPGTAVCFQPADQMMANTVAGSRSSFGAMGTPNMQQMLMPSDQSSSTDTLVAMLASYSPAASAALQASLSTGRLEDIALVGCGQKRPSFLQYPASAYEDSYLDEDQAAAGDDDSGGDVSAAGHNNYVEKKRRLNFDQVKSLEKNFELENKLEPERKIQLAKELGLQPRQVAVWFQNRRARWKTKQLERDYQVLSLDYNRLKNQLEAVLQEKQELQAKVQCLTTAKAAGQEPSAKEERSTGRVEEAAATTGLAHHHVLQSCKLEGLAMAPDLQTALRRSNSKSCNIAVDSSQLNVKPDDQYNSSKDADVDQVLISTTRDHVKKNRLKRTAGSRTNFATTAVADADQAAAAAAAAAAATPSPTLARKTRNMNDGSPSSASTYSSDILDAEDSPHGTINSCTELVSRNLTSASSNSTRAAADSEIRVQEHHPSHGILDRYYQVTDQNLHYAGRVINTFSHYEAEAEAALYSNVLVGPRCTSTSVVKLEDVQVAAASSCVFQEAAAADIAACNYLLAAAQVQEEHGGGGGGALEPWWDWP
ncbi:hypothetical protein CY35_14G050400 [Sphagnum magellanicum]|nr:hypothetical protein CY35_14G050400 [Sphagnum magellanicum]